MKFLKRTALWLLISLSTIWLLLVLSGNGHILFGLRSTYFIGKSKPDIDDLNLGACLTVPAGIAQTWPVSNRPIQSTDALEAAHDSLESTAFLVVHNGEIILEEYFQGFHKDSVSNTFSIAKSMTALGIEKAIEEGKIESLDQFVGDFLPEFKTGKNAELRIGHLMNMTSGIDFGESYSNPFGYQAKAYYGYDLKSTTLEYNVSIDPGTLWKYEGGNTVLLGLILKEATGQTMSSYFSDQIWRPIGAEHDAYWGLDRSRQMEKPFSAFYCTPRDLAKIGALILNSGKLNGTPIIDSTFVHSFGSHIGIPDGAGEITNHYCNQWWNSSIEDKQIISARGMRGQYLLIVPEDNLIVVRFGRKRSGERKNNMPLDAFIYLGSVYDQLDL